MQNFQNLSLEKPPVPLKPADPDEEDPLEDPNLSNLLASLDETEADALIKARTCQGLFGKGLRGR